MQPTVWLLAPVFVQVGLTLALMFRMGRARVRSIKSGTVHIRDIALGQKSWPAEVLQVSNAFHNQFELPVLFYLLVVLVLVTRQIDYAMIALAWIFVALRIAHAVIHTTSNHVPTRFQAYVGGALLLTAMWLYFAVRLFAAPLLA